MNNCLAIDIGSNAMRCAVGTLSDTGALKIVHSQRAAVGLGRSVFARRDRTIDNETILASKKCLADFLAIGEQYTVTKIRAIGTSALRDASNQYEFLSAISKIGLPIEVISGEEEASLIRRAIVDCYDVSKEIVGLLDIGGGSVEFTLMDHGEVLFALSEKIGTIRLLQAISEQKISVDRFSERVKKNIELLAEKVARALHGKKIDSLLATGGNVEELGRLRTRVVSEKKKDNKIRLEELAKIIDLLEPLTSAERQAQFGFRSDRADVIFPAAIILREVLKAAAISKIKIPKVGLREGILLELLNAK